MTTPTVILVKVKDTQVTYINDNPNGLTVFFHHDNGYNTSMSVQYKMEIDSSIVFKLIRQLLSGYLRLKTKKRNF